MKIIFLEDALLVECRLLKILNILRIKDQGKNKVKFIINCIVF